MGTENLLFFLLPFISLGYSQLAPPGKGRVVCYYPDWSPYRTDGGAFTPRDINPYLCTHVIYSFAKFVDEVTIAPGDENQDIFKNGFKDFVDLKTKFNDDLKVLLAIGGSYEGSTLFSPMSTSPVKRRQFAQNSLDFVRMHGFEGLNIDWQFPNDKARNGSAADFDNFVLLVKDIDEVFADEAVQSGKEKLLLSISVSGNTVTIDDGYDLPNLQKYVSLPVKYVEFMNVLCYDYHFAFEPTTNHHSQLYPLPGEEAGSGHENEGLNVEATIDHILNKGVQPEKLNLGVPLYGRTFTLADPNQNELGADATGQGAKGKATRTEGFQSYLEACKNLKDDWKVVHHNKTAMGPYAYKGTQWVGFDDEGSVRRKGEYAKQKGLGGLSFWSIDQDDFKATCGPKAFPLIKAGREGYLSAKAPTKTNTGVNRLTANRPQTKPTPPVEVPSSPPPPRPTTTSTTEASPPVAVVSPSVRPPRPRPTSTTEPPQPAVELSPAPPQEPKLRPRPWTPSYPVESSSVPPSRTKSTMEGSPAMSWNPESDELYDQDDSVVVEPVSSLTPPIRKTVVSPEMGLVQNIYVWITNNIFNNSPPQYVDTSIMSNRDPLRDRIKIRPTSPTPFINDDVIVRRSSAPPAKKYSTFHMGSPIWSR